MDPTDDYVEKRTNSITAIEKGFRERESVGDILLLASELVVAATSPQGLSAKLSAEIATAIKDQSPSFVAANEHLQIATCGMIAALKIVSESSPSSGRLSRSDLLAAGVWSGLSFQATDPARRLSMLQQELVDASHALVSKSSHSARERASIPSITATFPEAYEAKATNEAYKAGLTKVIDVVRSNAALDREELDLLWWVVGGWSEILSKSLSSAAPVTAAIAKGLEISAMIRRLPSDAHKYLAIRNTPPKPKLSLQELIERVAQDRATLAGGIESPSTLTNCSAAFPLLSAIHSGVAVLAGSDVKRDLGEWGERALLEGAILHLCTLDSEMN